jgi:hypothetical protein
VGQFAPKYHGQFAPKQWVSLRRNGVVSFIIISNLSLEQKERYRKGKEVELSDGTRFQYGGGDARGVRANKLALIASVIVDGGISYLLYKGLNAMFGQKHDPQKADVYSKGYYQALEDMIKKNETERPANRRNESEQSRAYTRSGYSR